jgi:hypothetical protein
VFSRSLLQARTIAITLAVAGLVAVMLPGPADARSVVADLWNWHEIQDTTAHEVEHTRQLDAEDETIQKRIEIKEALIADLIAGRATLAEVTDEFLHLNESREIYMIALRKSYPCTSDEEIIAHNVIAYTTDRTADSTQRATILARLECELVQMQTSRSHAR